MKRLIIFGVALLALVGGAAADFGSIVSSFRLSGTSVPYVTGVLHRDYQSVEYWGALYSAGPDYLLQYNVIGSVIGSYRLEGSLAPADMDYGPSHDANVGVLDVGRRALLEYVRTTGSFVGSRPVPPNTKGYGKLHNSSLWLAIGTWVYEYDRNWSIVSSFNTGMDIGAIAATPYFRNRTRLTVIVGPRGSGVFNCYVATSGSHVASFAVPGSGTRGATCNTRFARWPYFFCNRVTADGMYLYRIDIEAYSTVEPASLGRVKALFK